MENQVKKTYFTLKGTNLVEHEYVSTSVETSKKVKKEYRVFNMEDGSVKKFAREKEGVSFGFTRESLSSSLAKKKHHFANMMAASSMKTREKSILLRKQISLPVLFVCTKKEMDEKKEEFKGYTFLTWEEMCQSNLAQKEVIANILTKINQYFKSHKIILSVKSIPEEGIIASNKIICEIE